MSKLKLKLEAAMAALTETVPDRRPHAPPECGAGWHAASSSTLGDPVAFSVSGTTLNSSGELAANSSLSVQGGNLLFTPAPFAAAPGSSIDIYPETGFNFGQNGNGIQLDGSNPSAQGGFGGTTQGLYLTTPSEPGFGDSFEIPTGTILGSLYTAPAAAPEIAPAGATAALTLLAGLPAIAGVKRRPVG